MYNYERIMEYIVENELAHYELEASGIICQYCKQDVSECECSIPPLEFDSFKFLNIPCNVCGKIDFSPFLCFSEECYCMCVFDQDIGEFEENAIVQDEQCDSMGNMPQTHFEHTSVTAQPNYNNGFTELILMSTKFLRAKISGMMMFNKTCQRTKPSIGNRNKNMLRRKQKKRERFKADRCAE